MGSGGRRDTRPLPPVRCEDSLHDVLLPTIPTPTLSSRIPRTTSWREFMPRTASWRDMLVAQAGRARADASASVRARVFRTVSLPGSLADLSAEHLKGVVPPRAHLYAMHELFLDNFLARHERLEGKRLWLFNPLSPARVAWRWWGVVLLLVHVALVAPAAWVRYRCEQSTSFGLSRDPQCDIHHRRCPTLSELSLLPLGESVSLLLATTTATEKTPRGYGCRRELLEHAVSGGVRVFSATELMLGLSAATRAKASPLRLAAPSGLLFSLDLLVVLDLAASLPSLLPLLPPLPAAARRLLHATPPDATAAATTTTVAPFTTTDADADTSSSGGWFSDAIDDLRSAVGWTTAEEGDERSSSSSGNFLTDAVDDMRRRVGSWRAVRTVAAYRRVKQLPPPPGPWAQWLLEEWLLKPLIGPGLKNAVHALPTIGAVLAEAELLEAFLRNFLSSAKMLVLLASAAKAARVRRRLRAVRRQRATRTIARALRRALTRRAVARLASKHSWAQAATALSASHKLQAAGASRAAERQRGHGHGQHETATGSQIRRRHASMPDLSESSPPRSG